MNEMLARYMHEVSQDYRRERELPGCPYLWDEMAPWQRDEFRHVARKVIEALTPGPVPPERLVA